MGYGEIDQKAINTIRVLALNWLLPRHGCPAILP
jgi:hypothetical protein